MMENAAVEPKSKKQKLSQDTVDSDDNGSSDAVVRETSSTCSLNKNANGEIYFDINNKRRVTIRQWKGKTLIDIREFYGNKEELKPGKRGISLTLGQWKKLIEFAPTIQTMLQKPCRKSEEE